MNLNEVVKHAIVSRTFLVHLVWLNDKLKGTNMYAPHLKQASKSFAREAEQYISDWYKTHLANGKMEMTFNEILDAWEKLISQLLFAEPEQIALVVQALKALKEQAEVESLGDLPKAFLIREEAGTYSLFQEKVVMRSNGTISKIEFVPTHVQGCETETQAYQMAFAYAREIGLLPNIEKGENENE